MGTAAPTATPLIAPAQLALTWLAGPHIQTVPDGGPPTTPDDQAGQAENNEEEAPNDGPHLSFVIPWDTVLTPIIKNASMPANLGFGRGCWSC